MGIEDEYFRGEGEVNYRFKYKGKNRGFDVRLFVGITGSNPTGQYPSDYNLHMSGYSGQDDYMFDNTFLGRSETDGILSRQFAAEEGGFKTPTATGQSNSWLTALNLKTNIPGRLPIKLFADLGLYDKKYALTADRNFMYDYGFEITIIQNIFSVYFPIGFSDDIKDYYDTNPGTFGKWTQRIRYELRLEKLNPVKQIRTIDF